MYPAEAGQAWEGERLRLAAVHLRASSGKGLRHLIPPACSEASCVCIKKKQPKTPQPVPDSLLIGIPAGELPAEQPGPASVPARRALRAFSRASLGEPSAVELTVPGLALPLASALCRALPRRPTSSPSSPSSPSGPAAVRRAPSSPAALPAGPRAER